MQINKVKLFLEGPGLFMVQVIGVASDGKPMGTFATSIPQQSLGDHIRQATADLEAMEAQWTEVKDAHMVLQQAFRNRRINAEGGA